MEPPDATHWDTQEQTYRAGATSWDGIHRQIIQDNAAFREAADSQGFDEAHRAGAVLAEEAKTIAEWHAKVADKVRRYCHGASSSAKLTPKLRAQNCQAKPKPW
ncbi:hypothetical protein H7J86_31715 [Mycobacterium hackensackense]|nr:hypothetical protein [Mycobacterium hackensackense]MCV7256755.1 hypothetical protein [Mycobacterium hackensackense]